MRPLVVILLALVLLALVAGLAAPAGAAVITPDLEKVFTRALPSDATGVVTTPGGASAYVCGTRVLINHRTDVIVDRVGSNPWTKYWNGPASGDDVANDVGVSAKGQVYVVGGSQKANGDNRLLVLKYSAAGKRLWVRIFSAGYMGLMRDVCVDGSNNIYIAGQYEATEESTYNDALLLKYSATGVLRWRRTYDSPYRQSDCYLAVCRRPGGGVYVAGGSSQSGSDSDGIVMRYTATGTRTLVARMGENDGAYMCLYDAVVTSDRRLVVGGTTSVGSGDGDVVILSLNGAGDVVWSHTYDSGYVQRRGEGCEFLAAYGDGQVVGSGYWARHASGDGYAQVARTHFFDAAGNAVDTSTWDGPVAGGTEVHDMALKGSHVWIAGQCFGDAPYAADGFALRFDR
jgi:hypothetical protein